MQSIESVVELENIDLKDSNTLTENIYKACYKTLKSKISVIKIRASTLHLLIKYVMEEIENTPLKGTEQKEMSLKLIRELIIDLTDNEDEEILLKLLDNGSISNMIDLIVDATKGKLNINSLAETSVGCFSIFLPYLFGCKNKNKK